MSPITKFAFADLVVPNPWPVEPPSTPNPMPPPVTADTLRASSISPNSNWIAGSFHHLGPVMAVPPDIGRYFRFHLQPVGSSLQYVALPLSAAFENSALGVNDLGDVAGFDFPSPTTLSAAFTQLGSPPAAAIVFPGNIEPLNASANGINDARYVVGNGALRTPTTTPPRTTQVGFIATYDVAGTLLAVEELSNDIYNALNVTKESATNQFAFELDGINARLDVIGSATPTETVTVGGNIVVEAGDTVPLIGLMRIVPTVDKQGHLTIVRRRDWYILRDPVHHNQVLAGSVNGLNAHRHIVGVDASNAAGFFAEVSDQGVVSTPVSIVNPKGTVTRVSGISDANFVVGFYDKIHPFVGWPV